MQTSSPPPAPAPAVTKAPAWKCLDFRRFEKNTLQGFGRFQHVETGVTVNDCPVHMKNGKRWISFPAAPYEKDGAKVWKPIVEIPSRPQHDTFQADALAALNRFLMSPEYQQRRRASSK